MKKKIIIGIVVAIIAAATTFYYSNMVRVPVGEAPEESVLPATNTAPGAGPGGDNGAGIANPASVYCVQQGGKSEIREGESGQVGVCVMPDGTECDEWDFFRTKVCGATGAAPVGDNAKCGRENCHGLDIKCGPNVAEICTMEYRLGDKCLALADCGVVDGVCRQIPNVAFDACKTCVQKCETDFKNDQAKLFECENKCPAGN
jgi:putative hemolysin